MNQQKLQLRGRLSGIQLLRLHAILDSWYTPGELAQAVGISRRQIYRVYRHMGMPCQLDSTGHIMVNGVGFRDWYHHTYPNVKLEANQTFCLTCKIAVPIQNPETCQRGRLIYLLSYCPECGRKLVKIVSNSRSGGIGA